MQLGNLLYLLQFVFAAVIGIYFWNLLRSQQGTRAAVDRESRREMERLRQLRAISLTEPLASRTRPASFDEVVGQEEGLKALRAVLCGPNPQHVLVYGPPGVGKTAAARLVLEEARQHGSSPFKPSSRFVEVDATTARFDERGIADPLIGSVHDPIYQGAGAMGVAGIPQPKAGAVTRAHGGILFIDEIGELHPSQMNKLLKVLEDRKVFLESAYYSPDDANIPRHIHDIFTNGLPADFRLVGATTRLPHDLPAALRSRCVEVFFRGLTPCEIGTIAANAARKVGVELPPPALEVVKRHAVSGRDAVSMIQVAAGMTLASGRRLVTASEMEWVVNAGQFSLRNECRLPSHPQIGVAHGLAVHGANQGAVVEIEAVAIPVSAGRGSVTITGVIDEEELGNSHRTLRRKSTARGSVENVVTVLRHLVPVDPRDHDLHINCPGGVPIDGPSAGLTIAVAVASALTATPVDAQTCLTGEISIRGAVKPVGGIAAKLEAARRAGATRVLVPRGNWQELFRDQLDLQVLPVDTVEQALAACLVAGRGVHQPAGE
ncbi:MAG TPA: ATP-dependent protease LonB [Bacillota bacterium]|nr:ATP-dependent protease LonB [Bacillota bacterium]